jgi:signal transduction histidine kinase
MMLYDFLLKNEKEILNMAEKKTLALAGVRPNSEQLKKGLPVFYKQLLNVLLLNRGHAHISEINEAGMAKAAAESDEPAMAMAAGRPEDAAVAKSAGLHGVELLRLGYTLSHVVHSYGAMCQSITELASVKNIIITAREFRDLNLCLDVAIAGAVTEYQSIRNTQESSREIEHLGFLAHELRNAIGTVQMAIELIKDGTVGFGGSTGQVLDRGVKRIQELIDRSLTEVRLRVDPSIRKESISLLQIVNQLMVTSGIEALSKQQTIEIDIDPALVTEADQQLVYSAVSNLIQNALKYTRVGGKIQIRGSFSGNDIVIEVEDECGGLSDRASELFKPFEQQNEDRKGLGLGLTIAQKAINLNNGTLGVRNLPGKGCVFKITLPKKFSP